MKVGLLDTEDRVILYGTVLSQMSFVKVSTTHHKLTLNILMIYGSHSSLCIKRNGCLGKLKMKLNIVV